MLKKIFVTILISITCLTSLVARPKIALVLSGGGARGLAHIGVIKELEKIGIPFDMVYGTSIGALVGALYAIGYSPQDMIDLSEKTDMMKKMDPFYKGNEFVLSYPFSDLGRQILNLNIDDGKIYSPEGLINDDKVLMMLQRFYLGIDKDIDFKDLVIPFKCIATDINNSKEVVFDKGSLVDAVRASISLPVFFPPHTINGIEYVDGGLANNMPIDLALKDGADIVIAVDVSGSSNAIGNENINNIFSLTLHYTNVVVNLGVDKQREHANIIITPDLGKASTVDFNSAKQYIKIGEESVIKNKEAILEVVKDITLNPLDENRVGVYKNNLDFVIKDVNFFVNDKKITSSSKLEWYKMHFNFLVGQIVSDPLIDKLEDTLSLMPKISNFYKASYKLEDNFINIYFSSYNTSDYTLNYDVNGSLETVIDCKKSGKVNFIFDINSYLKFSILRSVNNIPLIFDINLNYLNSVVINPVFKSLITPWFMLSVNSPLSFGNLSYESLKKSAELPIDFSFSPSLELSFLVSQRLRLITSGGVNVFVNHLNNAGKTKDVVIYPYAKFGFMYTNTRNGYFNNVGYTFEGLATIGEGLLDSKGYSLSLNYNHNFKVAKHHYISYKACLSSYRSSNETQIVEQYFDIGGHSNLSGFPSKTYKQDFAYLNLRWDYQIIDFGVPIYLSLATAVGGFNKGSFKESNDIIFTRINTLAYGGSIALGCETPFGDMMLSLGLNSDLKLTLALGII